MSDTPVPVAPENTITPEELLEWREWMRAHPPVPEKVAKVWRPKTVWELPQQWNDPRSKL